MRKRERENPCGICGHYHKYEEGEACGVCGHRMATGASPSSSAHVSAFPSVILPEFLYLGSYDNASRPELLKNMGISCILNAVTACPNLYRNSFTYHCLQDDGKLPFDDAIQFIEKCEKDGARVLVHCMSGRNRSPALVIAYLMKTKSWKLAESCQWVKERRPSVDLNQAIYQQLQEYEQKIFGSIENSNSIALPICPSSSSPSFNLGFSKPNDTPIPVPAFNYSGNTSVFSQAPFDDPQGFTFRAEGRRH